MYRVERTNGQACPSTGRSRRSLSLALGLLMVVSAAACGDAPLPESERASASVAIYAAATRQLVEFDNTFGGPGHTFAEVLIVDHPEVDAGDLEEQGSRGDSLTEAQRTAIATALENLAPVRFISDASDFIQEDVLMPVIPGSAIIGLGAIMFDSEGATVGMSLWCGGLCGISLTYRVTGGQDGWTVVGTEGDVTIA